MLSQLNTETQIVGLRIYSNKTKIPKKKHRFYGNGRHKYANNKLVDIFGTQRNIKIRKSKTGNLS